MALTPIEPGRFFLPGPSEVHPEVLAAQARPVIGHRGSEIRALIERLQGGLRPLFGTERHVLLSTSSATGMMEAAVRNSAPGRMLCLVNGAFSERFVDIAESCARQVDPFEVPWGDVHDPEAVEERVTGAGYEVVTLVHSETSTGALNPVADLAAAVRRASPETLVVVDSVTGVGGAPFETDRWGVDFVVTGSQKALAVPPGLALAVVSERMLERARSLANRGFYFDLVRFHDEAARGQTPTTPAVTLLYALDAQLERVAAETPVARFTRHRALAGRCAERIGGWTERGITGGVLAPAGARSPTVTCIRLPEGVAGPDVVAGCRSRGWVIGGGYGKLKGTTVRVGHMGEHTLDGLDQVMDVMEEVLAG